MKASAAALLALLAAATPGVQAAATQTSPIQKVVEMLSELQKKVYQEGKEAQKEYDEFAEWCEDRSQELRFEIKTAKEQVAELTSAADKASADLEMLNAKIEELAAGISENQAELKKATALRAEEHKTFEATDAELSETIDALERAIAILEREMQKKGGAAVLAQLSSGSGPQALAQALQAMVDAAGVSAADASRLTALVQADAQRRSDQEPDDDDDDEPGAPSAAAYESHSGGIVETLKDLLRKAEEEQAELRKEESNAKHNYEMKKQSLEDQVKFATEELDESKKALAEAGEKKAAAQGELEATTKDLNEDTKELETLHHECMEKATDFEEETKDRNEEMKALAEAKKIIEESTGGAAQQTYGLAQTAASFLQVAEESALAGPKALRLLRRLATARHHSPALAQLVVRMEAAVHQGEVGGDGQDPFAKVKGLIDEMIASLEEEAAAEATEKAFCDKEMGAAKAKLEKKDAEAEKLSTAIAQKSSAAKKLRSEVAVLQKEMKELQKSQAEMDRLREEEKALYEKQKPELEQGLNGVKLALKVLREYYAKKDEDSDEGGGAQGGIIGLLEVCESDFSKGLAELIAVEESAVAEYEAQTKENQVAKATKEKDIKYKTKEATALEKAVVSLEADLAGVQDETAALQASFKSLQERCVAKPETYEERVKRRESEIAGLKEALSILEGQAVLLQRGATHQRRALRALRRH